MPIILQYIVMYYFVIIQMILTQILVGDNAGCRKEAQSTELCSRSDLTLPIANGDRFHKQGSFAIQNFTRDREANEHMLMSIIN